LLLLLGKILFRLENMKVHFPTFCFVIIGVQILVVHSLVRVFGVLSTGSLLIIKMLVVLVLLVRRKLFFFLSRFSISNFIIKQLPF